MLKIEANIEKLRELLRKITYRAVPANTVSNIETIQALYRNRKEK
jgi:hypothetical protein